MGTIAHRMIECFITGQEFESEDYSPSNISLAENALISFHEWARRHKIEPIGNELKWVSEKHKYGGTLDFLCYLDGELSLLDFKTGKAIYDEHFVQTAAYANLAKENGYDIKQVKNTACWQRRNRRV